MEKIKVYVEKSDHELSLQLGSPGSAGLDIMAAEDAIILPGETKLVATELRLAIPTGYEVQIRPRSGLSLKTSLRIANSPGTIDSDYRDEIKVICQNDQRLDGWKDNLVQNPGLASDLSKFTKVSLWDYLCQQSDKFNPISLEDDSTFRQLLKEEIIFLDDDGLPYGTLKIQKGERFAQMVFAKYAQPQFDEVDSLVGIGNDRGGGFGSTGRL